MLEIDRWILARTEDLVRRCRASYDENAFHKVYRGHLRFRDHGFERGVFRRSQRPALYRRPRAATLGAAGRRRCIRFTTR